MLPEPFSNSISSFFFVLMGQLLCFRISFLDQLNVPFRCFNAFLRFLLKGVQYINSLPNLERKDHAVSVRSIPQGDLKNAATHTFKRLGIFRHASKLD